MLLAAASDSTNLLFITVLGVAGLILLIAWLKLNAFVALLLASVFVGLCAGMKPLDVADAFQEGIGKTLGTIAVIVGLGTMLGKLLAESGGAEVVANTFIRWLGPARLPLTMVIVAFIVGLPVFFGVGILLLVPIIMSLARETRLPVLALGLPMVAGLSMSHCLVPPHAGPIAAIERLGADMGKTIAWSIAIGFPIALIVGVWFAKWAAPRFAIEPGGAGAQVSAANNGRKRTPGFAVTVFTIVLPVVLMLLQTVVRYAPPRLLPLESPVRVWADFIGSPIVSMLIALLFSFGSFGRGCGFSRGQLLKFTEDCVGPAANILLVVGAGGGFSKVLDKAGVAQAIADTAGTLPVSPLLLGWVVAVLIRIAVGSATVTITMTAALLVPIVAKHPEVNRELLVVALGAGSMIASHLNDGGFWFVKEYLNLTVAQTLKTWTVLVTILSVLVLGVVLLIDLLV